MGTVTDPIADMLTRIRNANAAGHDEVRVPASKLKAEIARILKEEGFIQDWTWVQDGPQGTLRITLKYGPKRDRVLRGIRRVSKPGLRVYVRRQEIPRVRAGLGIAILSTSRGILTDRQARRLGVGGEVLCYVW
ncbi:MAG: 30S ribosomal protein S8 [Armatimonadota bacterium]|nr:30S ribosomal protein S8 [Armatimonadota bacterium]MDR5675207.1 30S ribosomal protein S8 [Armatimonadota bacterium]MDR5690162.1 30S ribosomal protein S8 [Armatimonadota bacterium]MDR7389774.1 30S ribosomal protein S8 [Armatimonadota bacterium]MDR7393790.1 30S ribosomal protein S8 [Armatimonadota bacterium]